MRWQVIYHDGTKRQAGVVEAPSRGDAVSKARAKFHIYSILELSELGSPPETAPGQPRAFVFGAGRPLRHNPRSTARRALQALVDSALEATASRGHIMQRADYDLAGGRALLKCAHCPAEVQCLTRPAPNEIDIGGSAVATNCPQSLGARATGRPARPAPSIDAAAARELQLYIDNTESLYSRWIAMCRSLIAKKNRGIYKSDKAPAMFQSLVDDGARSYRREHGGGPSTFDAPTRRALARDYAKRFAAGELDWLTLNNPVKSPGAPARPGGWQAAQATFKGPRQPLTSGYQSCACRDCFETAVGEPGAFCSECREAGCPDYQGQPGMSQECQRPDAYGG